jgi:serine/threonine protein kinase
MDFVDGETLQQRLDRTTQYLPEADVLNWAGQICDVLDYLHSQNPPIVFRDLKPANVMLDRNSVIKLIDFGIARVFNPVKGTDTLKMGSVGYAPPEQYGGKGQTTPQSEIYALGATLHHLLTRRDPSGQPFVFPSPRAVNPAVSTNTEAAVFKALDYDPAKRFPSAGEMKAALFGQQSQMVTCPRCGQKNLTSEIYCQGCSAQLAAHRACPHCQHPTPSNAAYCTACGCKL